MKKIKALLQQNPLRHADIYKKENHTSKRLLYVAPSVNSDGYYRMILPYLELHKHEGFETRMSSIRKWDFNTTFTLGDDEISEQDIQWATHIIFPMLLTDHTYLFQAVRMLNPRVRLVMDVTRRIHKLPKTNPDYFLFPKAQQIHLGNNLGNMDVITTPTHEMADFYSSWFARDIVSKHGIKVEYLPSLVSPIGFESLLDTEDQSNDTIRIGLISTFRSVWDFDYLFPVLKKVQKRYPRKVKFIVMGWNGKHPNGANPLEGIEVTYHKSVSFLEYYTTLQKLQLDVLLLPHKNGFDSILTGNIKFLEAAALGIPVIAAHCDAYQEYIEEGYNGLLAGSLEDWESSLIHLVDHPEYRIKIGTQAKRWAWKQQSFTPRNLAYFREVYQEISNVFKCPKTDLLIF